MTPGTDVMKGEKQDLCDKGNITNLRCFQNVFQFTDHSEMNEKNTLTNI